MPVARAASSASESPVSNGARPGTCSAYSSLARSFVPITSTVSRSDAAAISSACSIARGVSTMAQREVWSGAPWAAIASTRARTSSADETFGTTIPSGPAAHAAARSSACHSVSAPLTRMVTSRRPYAPDAAAAHAASRAAGFASGATASSRSRISASHGIVFAFSSARSLEDGM